MKQENFGEIREKDSIPRQSRKLRDVWDRKKVGTSKNTLLWTIAISYKWDFLYLTFGNLIVSALNLTQPFFVAALVDYIKYGENRLDSHGIHFAQSGVIAKIPYISEGRLYGLTITVFFLLSQFLA